MRCALTSLAALVLFGSANSLHAQSCGPQGCGPLGYGMMNGYPVPVPQMHGMAPHCGYGQQASCSPGFYVINPTRVPYVGPYYPYQPPMPFNGMLPRTPWMNEGNGGGPGFPTHPYARSPRDFFMMQEMSQRE